MSVEGPSTRPSNPRTPDTHDGTGTPSTLPGARLEVPAGPMAKPESLRTRGQFGATLRAGRRERRALLAIAGRPNDIGRTRVGYAVSRRVGGAVVRNRVRRRLRELLRQHLGILVAGRSTAGGGWDLVVTAQPAAADASYAQLGADVESALRGLAEHRRGHRGVRPETPAAADGGRRG